MSLIGLLIGVLVLCVIVWAVRMLLAAFAITDPIRTVVIVVVVLICLLWLLNFAGVMSGMRLH